MIEELMGNVRQLLEAEGFAYVDYDKGQADDYQPKIKTPAGLVSVRMIDKIVAYSGKSFGARCTLQIRVIDWVSGNSSSASPKVQSDRWANWYNRVAKCCSVLSAQITKSMPIVFSSCEFVKRDDGLQEALIECESVIGCIAQEDRSVSIEGINVHREE